MVDENNALALPGELLPQKYDDKVFDDLASGAKYLGRLQLFTAQSKLCKSKKLPVDHYAYIKGDLIRDLGEKVDVAVLAWRPKALDMSGEQPFSVYDIQEPQFKVIQEKAEIKDSQCMVGLEFLVWIPAVGDYATFFMGSKSARRESPNMKQLLLKAATLGSKFVETTKFSWMAPQVIPFTGILEAPTDQDRFREVVEMFNNPPKTEVEIVDDKGEERAR